jgi:hypothetical protein
VIIAYVHFRDILSGYFLFSRFDWSIFITQLVAKHMKEIIPIELAKINIFYILIFFNRVFFLHFLFNTVRISEFSPM